MLYTPKYIHAKLSPSRLHHTMTQIAYIYMSCHYLQSPFLSILFLPYSVQAICMFLVFLHLPKDLLVSLDTLLPAICCLQSSRNLPYLHLSKDSSLTTHFLLLYYFMLLHGLYLCLTLWRILIC